MPQDALNHLQRKAIEDAKWVDKVLTGDASIAGIIVLLKILNLNVYVLNGITFKPENFWVIAVLFTTAHAYVTLLLIRSLYELWKDGSLARNKAVYENITETGGIFIRGLSPRVTFITYFGFFRVYIMDSFDPSTWVSHGAILLLMAAIIPWDLSHLSQNIFYWCMAIVIAVLNWLIGGTWSVALSSLTLDYATKPTYFTNLEEVEKNVKAAYNPVDAFVKRWLARIEELEGRFMKRLVRWLNRKKKQGE